MLNYTQPWRDVIKFLLIYGDLCCMTGASMLATCSIASAYIRVQVLSLKNNGISDSILTTTTERGNSWTTLIEEGRFGIASRPFGTIIRLAIDVCELFPELVFLSEFC